MSNAARLSTSIVPFGSRPRSKRKEASVLNPKRRAVRRIHVGLKQADSRKISVVDAVTPESSPPNTPPIHIGFSASQIIRSSAVSVRSMPSSVVNGVPAGMVRT